MKLLNEYYRMMLVALQNPEDWVAHVTYIDETGSVSRRSVSPVAVEDGAFKVYCLGRDALRTMTFERILRVQLRHASDVLPPEGVEELVSTHEKRVALAKAAAGYDDEPDESTET